MEPKYARRVHAARDQIAEASCFELLIRISRIRLRNL